MHPFLALAVLLALLLPLAAAQAQTLAPASRFEYVDNGCQSMEDSLGFGTHSTCVWTQPPWKLGRLRAVMLGTAFQIASTETRGAHATAGTGLVYRRADSTENPPSCGGPSECFTYQADLDAGSMNTCFVPGAATGSRGLNRASTTAEVLDDIRGFAAAERPGGSDPVLIMEARFDLVCWPEAQLAGFDPDFLVETNPADFAAFEAWLAANTAAPCPGGGCSWSWSDNGSNDNWNGRDVGIRLYDSIDALGGDPEDYAYYVNVAAGTARVYAPCAVADQSDAAYREWKLDGIEARFNEGTFDMVLLNNKFAQYEGTTDYSIMDSCSDNTVAEWHAAACGGPLAAREGFTGSVLDAGYTWADYVQGWAAFGTGLVARGIPYVVASNGAFNSTDYYDDAGTVGVNENDLVEATVYGASFVWVTDGSEANEAALVCELRARGIPYVEDDCDVEVCP